MHPQPPGAALPSLLCVDDDPRVLQGLGLTLRKAFAITAAGGGQEALAKLAAMAPPCVILSDMRMPGIDGAMFLARARKLAPDAVRLLLTGEADVQSSIKAINEGQIFRFLTKPCPNDTLMAALQAAMEQHRLITAERELLEKTVRGSILALTDVLGIVDPEAFGRATSIRRRVLAVAAVLAVSSTWQWECAALLSQIGYVTLPPRITEKLHNGKPLTSDEADMVDRAPSMTKQILGHIPRLEGVMEILDYVSLRSDREPSKGADAKSQSPSLGARVLKAVLAFDEQDRHGMNRAQILRTLCGRAGMYDPEVLTALQQPAAHAASDADPIAIGLQEMTSGMVLAEDVYTKTGTLLMGRGHEVTPGSMERLRNFAASAGLKLPILILPPI